MIQDYKTYTFESFPQSLFSEALILHDGTDSKGNPASGVRHNRCHPVYCGYGGGEFVLMTMFHKHFLLNSSLHTFSHTVSFPSQINNYIERFYSILLIVSEISS